jgi:hypothetical protein
MKLRILASALLAAALSGLTVSACNLTIRVACPNDRTAAGIEVCVDGVGCVTTDDLGIALIHLPTTGTFNVCVTKATLPAGATLDQNCQQVVCTGDPLEVDFTLGGDFCGTPPPQGACWLTGGGTVGKVKGQPNFSYGGVVYPGCSPKAADGGNWNVIDHFSGLHFQGQHIVVDSCSGVSTKSPKVNVNIIDFHGDGIISGIGGNSSATVAVTFVGRAIDNLEPGGGNDQLFISVTDGVSILLQIGNSAADPATISTGNLQIHTSSCGK